MNKERIIKFVESLNDTKTINITGTDRTKLIFNNKVVFDKFGSIDGVCLNPFSDYTYSWLSSFFTSFIDFVGYNNFGDLDELKDLVNDKMSEWVDSEVSVYTYDLTAWLNDRNDNVDYLSEVLEESDIKDGFRLLATAQYKAIEEVFSSGLDILMDLLKDELNK